MYLGLTCSLVHGKKNWKIWNFVSPTRRHTVAAVLQLQNRKNLSTDDSLSLSLSPLRTWALHSSSFSSFSSSSLPSAVQPPSVLLATATALPSAFALFFFLFLIFSDFSSLLFIPLFKSKIFVSLFKGKGFVSLFCTF